MADVGSFLASSGHAAGADFVRRKTMDRETVLHHLRAWADGVDPATGLTLPPDHPGQRPDTLRVVFAALALLSSSSSAIASGGGTNRPFAGGPRNAGRPWSADDDATLASGFDAGEKVDALAARLERTRGAINARLVRLGKIEPPPGLRLRGEPAQYIDAPALG
jgi:hypothetical protein